MKYSCPSLQKALNDIYEPNPYYEKWGKGRPSKDKILKRKMYHELERERITSQGGLVSSLVSQESPKIINENNEVRILFKPR